MVTKVTYNGKEFVQDLASDDTRKAILLHELGHYGCAKALGYDAKIYFDPDQEIFITHTESKETLSLEDYAIITLGGHTAEEICGIETCGFLADQLNLFNIMKEIYTRQGRDFPWQRVFEMPEEIYSKYHQTAKEILEQTGGKLVLEEFSNCLLEQFKKSNV